MRQRTLPAALERGLARHGYHYCSWRWSDDPQPLFLLQFRHLDDSWRQSYWRQTWPYEWTEAEAWLLLAELDAKQEHVQMEMRI